MLRNFHFTTYSYIWRYGGALLPYPVKGLLLIIWSQRQRKKRIYVLFCCFCLLKNWPITLSNVFDLWSISDIQKGCPQKQEEVIHFEVKIILLSPNSYLLIFDLGDFKTHVGTCLGVWTRTQALWPIKHGNLSFG